MKKLNTTRRKFIRQAGLATSGLLSSRLTANAIGFLGHDFLNGQPVHNIPADKNLDPEWIKSLYQKGSVTTYLKSKNELQYIGMPAGGLHTGTMYLGGDGRLWLYGIYNDDREGVDPKTVLWNNGTKEINVISRDGANYVEPTLADNKRVLEQGFAVKINYRGKEIIKELNETNFDEVKFEATYPVATIHYIDENLPVKITVKAGGIFIPLDADNSALPATVFSINIENKTDEQLSVAISGWLENGANKLTAVDGDGTKNNAAIIDKNYSSIFSSFNATKPEASQQRDAGTTCISFIGSNAMINTNARPYPVDANFFNQKNEDVSNGTPSEKLIGSITAAQNIQAKKNVEVSYVISWHFDHPLSKRLDKLPETKGSYHYGKRFKNALDVAGYIVQNFEQLHSQTLLWQQTYYDSTLPHWFFRKSACKHRNSCNCKYLSFR